MVLVQKFERKMQISKIPLTININFIFPALGIKISLSLFVMKAYSTKSKFSIINFYKFLVRAFTFKKNFSVECSYNYECFFSLPFSFNS